MLLDRDIQVGLIYIGLTRFSLFHNNLAKSMYCSAGDTESEAEYSGSNSKL